MASYIEHAYSLVHQDNTADQPSIQDLKNQLEKGTDESKMDTMRRILTIMLNGDPMPQLLMHIIRFVMPSKSKALKKLLYFYYEICPKLDANGKLKQEMILVWYVGAALVLRERVPELIGCDDVPATASGTTSSTPTNTSEAIPFGSSASYESPNSLNPSCPPLAGVWIIATPMSAKTPFGQSPLSTNIPIP
jgi:hypothetical protein